MARYTLTRDTITKAWHALPLNPADALKTSQSAIGAFLLSLPQGEPGYTACFMTLVNRFQELDLEGVEYSVERNAERDEWIFSVHTNPHCTNGISGTSEQLQALISSAVVLMRTARAVYERAIYRPSFDLSNATPIPLPAMKLAGDKAGKTGGELWRENEDLRIAIGNRDAEIKSAREYAAKTADSHNKLARKFLHAESVLLTLAYAVANKPDALPAMVGALREWVSNVDNRISVDRSMVRKLSDALGRRLETIPDMEWPVPAGFVLDDDRCATPGDRREPKPNALTHNTGTIRATPVPALDMPTEAYPERATECTCNYVGAGFYAKEPCKVHHGA